MSTRKEPYTLDELEVIDFTTASNPNDLLMAIRCLAANQKLLFAELERVNKRLDTFRGVQS